MCSVHLIVCLFGAHRVKAPLSQGILPLYHLLLLLTLRSPSRFPYLLFPLSSQVPMLQLSLSASALGISFECHVSAVPYLISLNIELSAWLLKTLHSFHNLSCSSVRVNTLYPMSAGCTSIKRYKIHFFELSKPFMKFGLDISCRFYSVFTETIPP